MPLLSNSGIVFLVWVFESVVVSIYVSSIMYLVYFWWSSAGLKASSCPCVLPEFMVRSLGYYYFFELWFAIVFVVVVVAIDWLKRLELSSMGMNWLFIVNLSDGLVVLFTSSAILIEAKTMANHNSKK